MAVQTRGMIIREHVDTLINQHEKQKHEQLKNFFLKKEIPKKTWCEYILSFIF
jgi:hypothetical protein